jgi:hypothetical protein
MPEQPAFPIAPIMSLAVAAEAFEEKHIFDSPHPIPFDAGLLDPAPHAEALPATGKHLWHERQSIQGSTAIQRSEDLARSTHLDQVSGQQHWDESGSMNR